MDISWSFVRRCNGVRLIVVFLFVPALAWSNSATLCESSEKSYFSCVAGSSSKILSVCGSSNLSQPDAYLQYRFGSSKKLDLEFPSARPGSIKRFRFYHYVRPQVSRVGLSFRSGDYLYTVYDDYEGDIEPADEHSGVSVLRSGTDTPTEIECKEKVVNRLTDLEEFVPCDPDNAMSDCPEQGAD